MAFFIHEIVETWEKRVLTDGGTISGVFYPPLERCTSLDQKTLSFWKLFERPGTPHEDWRREMAHEALRVYRGGAVEMEDEAMPYPRIVISSGHGKYVRGASGVMDEVDEARKLVEHLADELSSRGVDVTVFHDDTSRDQSTNLSTIVNAHNREQRDLDVSVHFNAFDGKAHGVEVLYVTQQALAAELSAAIAAHGFTNRGAKERTDLYFLNNTAMPAVLLEVCFCDNASDSSIYRENFDAICSAIADVLGGEEDEEETPPPEVIEPPPGETTVGRVDITASEGVLVYVNGRLIG